MKKQLIAVAMLAVAIFTSCKKNVEEQQANEDLFVTKEAPVTVAGQFVPNELLVKFKSGTNEKSRSQTLAFINGKVAEHILTPAMESVGDNQGVYLVNTTSDVFFAIARMKGESNIEYAEPNWIYYHQASNDPYYTNGSLWGMYGDGTTPTNQYGSQAGEAWAGGNTGSSTVYVGVIDEGYMYNHVDLAANAGVNPKEIAGNGNDDDGNGLVDDVYGWDFANNDNSVFDGTGDDHGTHVAGTIGGVGGNGIGVAGVCWNVKLLNAKFLGANGGTTANAVKAVDYFTDLKNKGLNIVATNNSWGGGGFSQALKDAITRAGAADILFIAAAGNDGLNRETNTSYPSGYDNENIIAVASITSTGVLSSFSNYAATKVDIGAPGSGITSTLPATSRKGKNQSITSGYGSYSGTSMATPHVTGAAALYKSTHNTATAADIKAAILGSAVPTASLSGKCVTNGRLNVSGF